MGGIGEQNRRDSAHALFVNLPNRSHAPENLRHARWILQQLVQLGLREVFLAPGARSVPLVVAATENVSLRLHGHFDERGLAFAALGYARTIERPVAVVTTSGSAVANLWPAVVEASYDGVPLILLTADRPAELRGSGANQTIWQPGIFGREVRWSVDLPPAGCAEDLLGTWLRLAWEYALGPLPGPVHVNCPFAEPLLKEAPAPRPVVSPSGAAESAPAIPQGSLPPRELFARPDGVIVVGGLPHPWQSAAAEPLLRLSRVLGWPILADALSGLKGHPGAVQHADLFLSDGRIRPPGAVLHFGAGVVTRSILQWLGKAPAAAYYHFPVRPQIFDPWRIRPQFRPGWWPKCLAALLDLAPARPHPARELWQRADGLAEELLARELDQASGSVSEPAAVRAIADAAATQRVGLLLGNSMPVRHFQAFVGPLKHALPVQGNRGTSGIDGNVATLAGINLSLPEGGFWGILGDLAVLHDLNSLALWACLPQDAAPTLFILNNQGGGIFPFLPLPITPAVRERWLETPHPWSFAAAARQFGLSYQGIGTSEELRETLVGALPRVVEIRTDRAQTVQLFRRLQQMVAEEITL